MITIKKILLTFLLFFTFNTQEIDSNNDRKLIYNRNDIHEEGKFKVYFRNINSKELKSTLDILNIEIINFIIDDKKYYVSSIDSLIKKYTSTMSLEEKIYYELNGLKIDGITIVCEIDELIKLENLESIY